MRRAILSVSNKHGLIDFARGLAARGFELVSTGGTARALADAGLAVTNVSAVTGFPEMMDGRVKTLHPAVHGGILARRAHPEDLDAARAHGIGLVDLVVVNLYPFVKTAATPGVAFDDLVEQIDIGGPSMVRAAAKNFRDVLIVVEPRRYDDVLHELDGEHGPSLAFRFDLAREAFAHTGAYDTAIAATLSEVTVDGADFRRDITGAFAPERLLIEASKIRDLRYGENPHQPAAWYATAPPAGLGRPQILQGKELSFTNLLDLDAAARIALEFDEPAAVVIKHTNPCGAATGSTIAEAYERARDADALAAFGGIVGLNRSIDADTARAIVSTFIEAVVAPGVDDDARAILGAKANMRVVVCDFSVFAGAGPTTVAASARRELRSVLGAVLVQERDAVVEARTPWPSGTEGTLRPAHAEGTPRPAHAEGTPRPAHAEGTPRPTHSEGTPLGVPELKVVTKRAPTAEEWQALRFAWRVMAHVKSNTVIFTDAQRTLAIGAGQMSRVDAVKVATHKAAGWAAVIGPLPLAGSVVASDAFFPFRDGLDAVAAAGATAVVQPGGSVRDAEVIAAADEHGIAMVFAGRRHFRH